jgi:hypothetical protein
MPSDTGTDGDLSSPSITDLLDKLPLLLRVGDDFKGFDDLPSDTQTLLRSKMQVEYSTMTHGYKEKSVELRRHKAFMCYIDRK